MRQDDKTIISLYQARDERAIEATRDRYGRYCGTIASNILHDKTAEEECVNDTYFSAWNAIPPTMPEKFKAFIGKICRNVSLKRYRSEHADKRGGGEVALSLDELGECVPGSDSVWDAIAASDLAEEIDSFLETLPEAQRVMFMRRYFYFETISEISTKFECSESKVKMSLKRTRDKLSDHLKLNGYL